jgi:hypothetical protein
MATRQFRGFGTDPILSPNLRAEVDRGGYDQSLVLRNQLGLNDPRVKIEYFRPSGKDSPGLIGPGWKGDTPTFRATYPDGKTRMFQIQRDPQGTANVNYLEDRTPKSFEGQGGSFSNGTTTYRWEGSLNAPSGTTTKDLYTGSLTVSPDGSGSHTSGGMAPKVEISAKTGRETGVDGKVSLGEISHARFGPVTTVDGKPQQEQGFAKVEPSFGAGLEVDTKKLQLQKPKVRPGFDYDADTGEVKPLEVPSQRPRPAKLNDPEFEKEIRPEIEKDPSRLNPNGNVDIDTGAMTVDKELNIIVDPKVTDEFGRELYEKQLDAKSAPEPDSGSPSIEDLLPNAPVEENKCSADPLTEGTREHQTVASADGVASAEDQATTSADGAATSEDQATTSADGAATSEDQATTSADGAATSEDQATTSADGAATSEDQATTSAAGAAASEAEAEDSKTQTQGHEAEAEAANATAQDAAGTALDAKQETEDSRDEAKTAEVGAEEAKTGAETEQADAEAAKKGAESEEHLAEDAKLRAEDERDAAGEARGEAEEAKNAAQDHRDEAQRAREKAEEELRAAEQARSQAEDELREAERAREQAQEELRAAEQARSDAEQELEAARAAAREAEMYAQQAQAAAAAAQQAAQAAPMMMA